MTVRQQIIIFLIATFAVSWLLMGYIVQNGGMEKAGLLIVLVMWIPGFICLALRLVARLGFQDIGSTFGAGKYWALAFFTPLGIAAIAFGISWVLGISEFRLPSEQTLANYGVSTPMALAIKINALSFLIGFIGALGEELGWRGFLVPKLVLSGIKNPLPISAAIWGFWHFPLIYWGGYVSSDYPIISVLLVMIIIMPGGVMIGWLRMASGSVWVATMAHAAHNLFLQTTFEMFNKPGPLSPYLSGEAGVIPCLIYIAVFMLALRVVRSNISAAQHFAHPH